MNHKQKKRIAWGGIILVLLIFIGGIGWVFRDEMLNLTPGFIKTPTRQTQRKSQSIPRTTSYLGRIRSAQGFLEQGQLSRAAIELSEAIAEHPKIIRPYVLLGEVHLRARDFGKIEGLITALQNKFPNAPEIDVLRARTFIAREEFQAAQKILKSADTETLSPAMRFYQAVLDALQNNHTEARKLLTELKKLPVQEPLILDDEGVKEETMDDALTPELAQKVDAFQKVYTQFDQFADGKDPHLFALLAKALAENDEPILARSFADVAIREDISYVDAWMLRGYSNFLLNNLPSAVEDLRHAYQLDPVRPEVEYFLALALEKSGAKTEAALFYEKLLTRDFPYKSEVRWKLISLLTEAKEIDRVIELYQEQAKEEPAPSKFISGLNTIINILHRPEDALEITATLLQKQPENVLALNLRAWALIETHQLTEAEMLLKKAEKLNPKNPRTQLNLGLLKEREGSPLAAREFYKKCYELGQGQPYNSVVELAIERYNTLIKRDDEAATKIPASSP